ncbi:MAG: KTSC domain-containing protein [Rhizomicrobium sp.]
MELRVQADPNPALPVATLDAGEHFRFMPSAVIASYTYNADVKELSIAFRSGARYTYKNVPLDTFDALNHAFSKGEFFQSRIRDHFEYRREPEDH